MNAVIDASVLAKWFVEEDDTVAARRLQHLKLVAPDLLIVETTNVLWKKVRLVSSIQPFWSLRCELCDTHI